MFHALSGPRLTRPAPAHPAALFKSRVSTPASRLPRRRALAVGLSRTTGGRRRRCGEGAASGDPRPRIVLEPRGERRAQEAPGDTDRARGRRGGGPARGGPAGARGGGGAGARPPSASLAPPSPVADPCRTTRHPSNGFPLPGSGQQTRQKRKVLAHTFSRLKPPPVDGPDGGPDPRHSGIPT